MTTTMTQRRDVTTILRRVRHRRLASLAAAALVVGGAPFISSASASAFTHQLNCQAETFPPAGTPRNSAGSPYNAPFNATLGTPALGGGHLLVAVPGAALDVELGPPGAGYADGQLFGEACGLLTLPSLTGPIAGNPYGANGATATGNPDFNNNFILHGPPPGSGSDNTQIPVALMVPGTNVPLTTLQAYGSADGPINTQVLPTAAANGGFNVAFTTSAKSTATLGPSNLVGLLPLPGSPLTPLETALEGLETALPSGGAECTLAIGNLLTTGLTQAQVGALPGANLYGYTTPAKLSTQGGGSPITGPITAAQGVAFSDTFAVPPISPDMPPDPAATGAGSTPSTLCTPTVAGILNNLFGLTNGAPAGDATFLAPVTFAANITS